MTINRRSIALGLTVGLLAGGTGGALAATTSGSTRSDTSGTATTWTSNGAWSEYGYASGWNGDGSGWNGDGSGWNGDRLGWNGYGTWDGYADLGRSNLRRTTTTAAAAYLDLTTPQVKSRLRSGKTLADLAMSERKSVPGLEKAIIAAVTNKVQSDSALTAAQKATVTANAKARIDSIVENARPIAHGSSFGAYHGPMLPY